MKSLNALLTTYCKLLVLLVAIPLAILALPVVALMDSPNRDYIKYLKMMFQEICQIHIYIKP